jgi:hypothetical protein
MGRSVELRQSLPPERFLDVDYADLVRDPTAVIRQIDERFGYAFPQAMFDNIARWKSENPQHKHGVHRYSLEEFDLQEADVQEMFAEYLERFNVAVS